MDSDRIKSVSDSVKIGIPADEIWEAVSDVTRVPEWSPECVKVRWENPPIDSLIGAKFVGSNKRGWLRWKGYCEVTKVIPGRNFSYNVRPVPWIRPVTRWTWDIRVESAGVSLVTLVCQVQLHYITVLGRILFGPFEQRMAEVSRGIHVTLRRLKSSLESEHS